jgi:hypothetical protein
MKAVASFWLEKGCSLGYLETLLGSQTLGNTILTQISFKPWNVLGLAFFALWALSPLGSQSSLHFISVTNVPTPSNTSIYYFFEGSASQSKNWTGFIANDIAAVVGQSLNALYNTLLMSPPSLQNSSMDLWGNVKIPSLELLAATTTANETGWLDATAQSNWTYSSLLGVPLGNISDSGVSQFTIETSYMALNCLSISLTPFSPNDSIVSHSSFGMGMLQSDSGPIFEEELYGETYDFIDNSTHWGAQTLIFESRNLIADPNTVSTNKAICPITTTYAEASITCHGKNCTTTAVRPSQQRRPNTNLTNLGFAGNFEKFNSYLFAAQGQPVPGFSSSTELYLYDPKLATQGGQIDGSALNILSPHTFGIRLQQVVNAFWYGAIDSSGAMGGFAESSAYATHAGGTNTILIEHYSCNWPWLAVFVLATVTMLIAIIVTAVCSALLIGPDVLGYCSSLIRNTPYVEAGFTLSNLSGMDRSKELSDVYLKLVDVEGDKDVGLVAIADNTTSGEALRRGRLYR